MTQALSALGIIPARGGSKGVPRKNIRPLAGRPLVAYSIEAAKTSRLLTRFVMSTDDPEIAEIARSFECDVIMRPKELATDHAPTLPVVTHVIEVLQTAGETYDCIVLLQPTTPLRTAKDIDASLVLLDQSGADAVVSVAEVPGHYHPDWQFTLSDSALYLYNGQPMDRLIPRRQMLSKTYTRNGAIYAVRVRFLLEHKALIGPTTCAYLMPESRSVNIDSELDFQFAELLLQSSGVLDR